MTAASSADEETPLVGSSGGGDAELLGSSKQQVLQQETPLQQLVKQHKIPLIILYYGLCSSTLIVINKVAVHNITVSVVAGNVRGGGGVFWTETGGQQAL